MRQRKQILIADDNPANLDIFQTRLSTHGYDIRTASDGVEALAQVKAEPPDLLVLDIMLPKMDGIEVCRRLKSDPDLSFIPVILVTAQPDPKDVVIGLDAGAEEYLTKPIDQTALVARVKSMLRIKMLHDQSREQAARLEVQARQLAEWNRKLKERVDAQVTELERIGQLKRYFSPQLAELLVSPENQRLTESHRQEITVVICDLRGFTAFAETTEPEEVMRVLNEFHQTVGPLIFQFEATLEHFTGDGLVAFFNDPLPCPDPAARAVQMAVAMQEEMGKCIESWRHRGHALGFGIGIALGYATLGQIGFEGRLHYGAVGTVLNLASRLCDQANSGQILADRRVVTEIGSLAEIEPLGELQLKGFHNPVPAYAIKGLEAAAADSFYPDLI